MAISFIVGSHLYGLTADSSDTDIVQITNDGDIVPNDVEPLTGPTCVSVEYAQWPFTTGKTPRIEIKRAHPCLFLKDLCLCRRWAWEPWLLESQCETHRILTRLLHASNINDPALSHRAFIEYENFFLPYALTDYKISHKPSYVADFDRCCWHCKVAYYLEIELHFRHVFGKLPAGMLFTQEEREYMQQLKAGLISKNEWYNGYKDRSQYLKTVIPSNAVSIQHDTAKEHFKAFTELLTTVVDYSESFVSPDASC